MFDLEYDVWAALHAASNGYSDEITAQQAQALRELSAFIDGWVDYEGYVPMAEWQRLLDDRQ